MCNLTATPAIFKKDNAEDKIHFYNLNSVVLLEAQQKIESIHHLYASTRSVVKIFPALSRFPNQCAVALRYPYVHW